MESCEFIFFCNCDFAFVSTGLCWRRFEEMLSLFSVRISNKYSPVHCNFAFALLKVNEEKMSY